MTLGERLSRYVHGIDLNQVPPRLIAEVKTLVIDAIACMLAGAGSAATGIAAGMIEPRTTAQPAATILLNGALADPASTALVNGATLRVLDLLDTYVGLDVSHPSECIPAALACAEAAGASGKRFLETVLAGYGLHLHFTDQLPLHHNGLHHVGHAAWIVPLLAARAMGVGEAVAAGAVQLMAARLLVPEGFALGHVANLKAFAYALIARDGIGAVRLARSGLTASPAACDEAVQLLQSRFGMDVTAAALCPSGLPQLSAVLLKTYPAQYALQALIAGAAAAEPDPAPIERIVVATSRRVIQRTADPAKYNPGNAESADHSLPFCVALALRYRTMTPSDLSSRRWEDPELRALMAKIETVTLDASEQYGVPAQSLTIHRSGREPMTIACRYPPDRVGWRQIACEKLAAHAPSGQTAAAILEAVEALDTAGSVTQLIDAMTRERA